MILIMSAAYCSSDFELEFGKIPPSFLPLGNKRLYEYQIKLFENLKDKIYLSLPQSFNINRYDLENINKFNINLLFIPDGLNLGEALIYSINMISPINETLYVLHGDAYFNFLEFDVNSLTLTRVKENYNWAYFFEKKISNYFIKNNIRYDDKLILSGFMSIENPYFLIKCIVEHKYSFIEGLKKYSNKYFFKIFINDSWLDFGLITNYFHSKKAITSQRCFNELQFCDDGYILKTSSWIKKIKAEINWFEKFPKELDIYIPKFKYQNDYAYKIEYLYNNTLAELFVFGTLPCYVWENIFKSLKTFLNRLHKFKKNTKNVFNYNQKTLDRLKLLSTQKEIWQKLNLNKKYYFENKNPISLQEILDEINQYLNNANQEYCIIHGDFCFSNIMFDFRSGFIKTFDPRGMDFDENITIYGDQDYDYAKLIHCVFGMYDFIIANFYSCKIDDDKIHLEFYTNDEIFKIQDKFLSIFKPNKKIFAIVIHLFLSMLPLHNDDEYRQKAIFANVFRLYFILKDKGLL
ncbi:capsular biosynthesis protein [Campylobacter lari]|uniref:aminoglycoside phosphotransferase family protein n=1 Tax=Campylobacter lari TaxID=201 RepID=UPI0021F795B6|nr:aminoglycoside phosphotransferase family protein [Campylobacter lari]EIY6495411.1 capsular biosynthesis protein [Campylobacter lari]MCW0205432.1 aminoglycoside phosphotransferase family protein [Campylobacter lari]HEG5920450.1 capsular biosynthesis protein [Campylobacter lari]